MATQKVSPKLITPSATKDTSTKREAAVSDKMKEKAKEETHKVRGIFRIYEKGREGCSEKITCKKYPESICPMFVQTMTDGQEYEIPLYAARFLNGIDSNAEAINGKLHTCSYPTHGWRMDHGNDLKYADIGYGDAPNPNLVVTKRTRRFGFESLEFAGALS